MELIGRFLSIALIIAVMVWYLIFAPESAKDFIGGILVRLQLVVFWTIEKLKMAILVSVHVCHWIGRGFVVVIFFLAAVALAQNIADIFEVNFLDKSNALYSLTKLLDDKVSWVAATAIIATTVALGNFKTLDLNINKYWQEAEERARTKLSSRR